MSNKGLVWSLGVLLGLGIPSAGLPQIGGGGTLAVSQTGNSSNGGGLSTSQGGTLDLGTGGPDNGGGLTTGPGKILKGQQKAVVAGPGGEEIDTDKYGRVKQYPGITNGGSANGGTLKLGGSSPTTTGGPSEKISTNYSQLKINYHQQTSGDSPKGKDKKLPGKSMTNPGPTQKGSVNPGPIGDGIKVGINPGPPQKSGKASKLNKTGLSNGKGFQKATGLKNANGFSKNGLGGAGGINNLPAGQK